MSRTSFTKVLVLVLGTAALAALLALGTNTFAVADAPAAAAKTKEPLIGTYPPYPEFEYERSVIRIPVTITGDTKPREIVELTAFMKLERETPVRNTIGYRQLEFTIREWELFGYSEVLGAHVSFAASPDVIQPKSLAVSLQKETDFPALIVYNAIYDIFLDGRKIISQRPGVAMARGVMEIPPRNITVAFQKPFAVHAPSAAASTGSGSKPVTEKHMEGCFATQDPEYCIIFGPGTCEDMTTITAEEFEAGLTEARAIREELATLKPKSPKRIDS